MHYITSTLTETAAVVGKRRTGLCRECSVPDFTGYVRGRLRVRYSLTEDDVGKRRGAVWHSVTDVSGLVNGFEEYDVCLWSDFIGLDER